MIVNLFAPLLLGILYAVKEMECTRSRRSIFGSLLGETSKKYESTTWTTFPMTSSPLLQRNHTTSHAGTKDTEDDGCKTKSGDFCYFPHTFDGFTYYTCIETAYGKFGCVTKKGGGVASNTFDYCQESCLHYDCDSDVQGVGAVLTSPNYPEDYPARKNCAYRIRLNENQRVALKFIDFSIEGNGLNNW